jgi:hypothetical protein
MKDKEVTEVAMLRSLKTRCAKSAFRGIDEPFVSEGLIMHRQPTSGPLIVLLSASTTFASFDAF